MTLELLARGGPVLWLTLALGALAAVVFLERALHLHRARIDEMDLLEGIFNNLRRGNTAEALTICEDTPGPVAQLVATAIQRREAPRETLIDDLDTAGRAEISRMERRLSVIALVAQLTPMLGLLGTVMGLLHTVLALRAAAPIVQLADVADGLVPALVTTAAGLLVAIPCYAAFNVLVVKIDRLVLDMEHASSEIVQFLDAQRGRKEPA
jgi:biopolymer transport protein ExbB